MDDDAAFCPGCGSPTQAQPQIFVPQGRSEVIVREVPRYREQRTIDRYQSFGWRVLSSQAARVTESGTVTRIKLSFERNTGMRNYRALDEKYGQYRRLEAEYNEIEEKMEKFSLPPVGIAVAVIVGVIAMVIGYLHGRSIMMPVTKYTSVTESVCYGIFWGLIWGVTIGLIVVGIWGVVRKSVRRKRTYAPRLAELDRQMNQLASDAAKYLS